MKPFKFLALAALALACGGVNAQSRFDLGKLFGAGKDAVTAVKGFSDEEEIEIGRGLAGRILGQVQLVNDANVQAYVNRVGRWIASQSERPDLPWRFGVANAANINAMAMPGGTILITRGLYDILDNEAQLAGVLGHEIAHVVKRHHITVMQKQSGVSALAGVAGASSKISSNQLSTLVLDAAKNMFLSGLDRGSEIEADSVGVILAARAGYNAFGLAEVLHKLNARARGDAATEFLYATHPSPKDRLDNLGNLLTPRVGELGNGLEPTITPVSGSAAAPRAGAAPVAGARQLNSEGSAPKAPPAASRAAPAAPSDGGASGVMDAVKGLKGLFGR